MYAIVEDNTITQIITNPKALTIGDVQYPSKIFGLWSEAELQAIGIYTVTTDFTNFKDQNWYINTDQTFAFADNVVTRSWGTATPKAHADSNAVDKNGDELDPVQVIDGLKTTLIKNLKKNVANELSKTDWYITRNTEKSTAIPSAITNHRDAVRTKQVEMETLITNASDTPALETLYTFVNTGTEENPNMTRPLGVIPTLDI